jgi:hypothetical protein
MLIVEHLEALISKKHTKQGRVIGTFSSVRSTKYRILAGHSPSPVGITAWY